MKQKVQILREVDDTSYFDLSRNLFFNIVRQSMQPVFLFRSQLHIGVDGTISSFELTRDQVTNSLIEK